MTSDARIDVAADVAISNADAEEGHGGVDLRSNSSLVFEADMPVVRSGILPVAHEGAIPQLPSIVGLNSEAEQQAKDAAAAEATPAAPASNVPPPKAVDAPPPSEHSACAARADSEIALTVASQRCACNVC